MRIVGGGLAGGIAGALLVVGLAGCAPSPADVPEPETLTASEAGQAYLAAVCPVNDAWNDVDLEIDRLRLEQGRGSALDPAAAATALTQLEQASAAGADALDPAHFTWPAAARDAVAEVRESLSADAKQAATVAELSAAKLIDYDWRGAAAAGAAAEQARGALELSSDPAAACAQWDGKQRVTKSEDSEG